jgi:hypothetical protein
MLDNSRNQDEVSSLYGKIFWWILGFALVLSLALFLGGRFLSDPIASLMKEFSMIIFGAVLVTILHHKILSGYFQQKSCDTITKAISPHFSQIHSGILEALQRIIPEVKTETVRSIDDIRQRVTEASDFMLNGIGVLSGAKQSGIVNIFPTRYAVVAGEKGIDIIARDISSESTGLRVMGISLGDYFLDRGMLHNLFIEKLGQSATETDGTKIRALIVHPKSQALKERARWEAGPDFFHEPAFFDSTTFIETDGAARIAKRLCSKYAPALDVRLYDQAPTCFVLLTSRFAFIEN